MTIDKEKYLKKLEHRLELYTGKFMSNSKWAKLFKKLSQHADIINKCFVKSIWDDNLQEIQIPNPNMYSDIFNDNGIKDVFIGGPFQFKEIEQLVFLKTWTHRRQMRTQNLEPFKYQQDIEKILDIVRQVGKFETHIDNDKLVIYAYK